MCGPADYQALQTCIVRMVEVSAVGLTACALQQAVSYFGAFRADRLRLPETQLTADAVVALVEVK